MVLMRHSLSTPGVLLQAVNTRRFLEVTDMGVLAVVTIVAPRAFHGPLAAGRAVVVVADVMTLILRASALWRCTAPSWSAAASSPGISAAARCLLPRPFLSAAVNPAARLQLEGVFLLDGICPPFSHLPVCERHLPRRRPAGRLSEDGVDEINHRPACKNNSNKYPSTTYCAVSHLACTVQTDD